jgi:hypothetical protein
VNITKIELHGAKSSPNLEIILGEAIKERWRSKRDYPSIFLVLGFSTQLLQQLMNWFMPKGASIVKYTEKGFWCIQIIIVLVKRLKVVAKCCLNWIFFHGALYCCVRYSTIEYQHKIFKIYL